jgi:lipoprotein-anchoring transpeptidase ErfK/SrfK
MKQAANDEVVAEKRARWWRARGTHRGLLVVGVVFAVGLLLAGGAAYAGYQYSEKYEGRILPGSTIAGVDVGGMTGDQAILAIKEAISPQLTRSIDVSWKERTWSVTPKELGARSNARGAVNAALAASREKSFLDKVRMRLLGDDLGFQRDIAITYPRQGAQGFVEGIAAGFDKEAVDSAIDYSTGWVEFTEERAGRKVRIKPTRSALLGALQSGDDSIDLEVKSIEPAVTDGDYDQVLLVRIGENKLYLYEDGEIVRQWDVATGEPAYPTPTGLFEVTLKRYMPTWVNPSPDTWGKDLPLEIPPGPNNPLGLRAINWDAPAIRFHGTQAVYSLGYNASHGCVRMANEDVIELYDMIDVGTPIVSIEVAPPRVMASSSTTVVDQETTAVRDGNDE